MCFRCILKYYVNYYKKINETEVKNSLSALSEK